MAFQGEDPEDNLIHKTGCPGMALPQMAIRIYVFSDHLFISRACQIFQGRPKERISNLLEEVVDRDELIAAIAERTGHDVSTVTDLVDTLTRVLAEDLVASGKVVLPGIGVIRRDPGRAGEFLLTPDSGLHPLPEPKGRSARTGERIKNALRSLDFITKNI